LLITSTAGVSGLEAPLVFVVTTGWDIPEVGLNSDLEKTAGLKGAIVVYLGGGPAEKFPGRTIALQFILSGGRA